MALTCDELVDEVRDFVGRSGDTELVTEARVLRWLNKAQEEIAKRCPGLIALDLKNTTSVDFTSTMSYSLAEFTSSLDDVTTENRICHIDKTYYIDGNESQRLKFLPLDKFDEIADPTSSDYDTGKPKFYTRRASNLEIRPFPDETYYDKDFRVDGWVYPIEFTAVDSAEESSLERADDGLIYYASMMAWKFIGGEKGIASSLETERTFNRWLDDYKRQNDLMHQWEDNIFGEYE